MPLPFVIPIIIAFSVGVVGTASVCKWDDINYALKGKNFAVLGARAVGKTTLLKYLEKGILIERYKQTLDKEEVERTRVKLGDLDIRLRKTDDVSGDQSAYGGWKNLFDESDLILYIVRTDELLKRDPATEKRCEDDLKQIQGWIKESKKRKQFFIVGNHWNTDPAFKRLGTDKMGNYTDEFRALPVVKKMTQLAGGSATVKVALGSLATERDADVLITSIFQKVEK
ncbi:GTPase domain-containing protein [Laspinema olomoucense]|uniref:GTPase domain-containing protein n=1 Tax=Laspinema olomoucense D3b TaxID=2953688 RepID=A0ABT2N724_9CYAN|nr:MULTISPECIES: GTPase domain-containing protein [unclassified Laspinema]MCT7976030.1 GTPase domain-containing protein [Laspinema sp. D3d]MCT7978502.1 GTPase domain-containing protein [Laspinema sp. D3b]